MTDYRGAKNAMRTRFADAWGATTPVSYQNKRAPTGWSGPWPPVTPDGRLLKWVYFEILGRRSELVSPTGTPGNRLWAYHGDINAHVFAPIDSGDDDATDLANQAGEIFRAAKFYEGPDGRCIRTLSPFVDDGDTADDDGNWFRVSMSVPFTYWHRG
jgi:hypothetical protein